MKPFSLTLSALLLLTSCSSQQKSSPAESTQSAVYQNTSRNISLSLPDEDFQLLKCHHPQLLKKIRDHLMVNIDDIIVLQQLGFTSDIVIMIINHTDSHFQLSTVDILRLQAEGVPFKVINYMIRT